MPDAFAFRFSTKYWEPETAILHYELRPYAPSFGRWLSRDPIGERGGLNLYLLLANNGLIFVDVLGLSKNQNNPCSEFNGKTPKEVEDLVKEKVKKGELTKKEAAEKLKQWKKSQGMRHSGLLKGPGGNKLKAKCAAQAAAIAKRVIKVSSRRLGVISVLLELGGCEPYRPLPPEAPSGVPENPPTPDEDNSDEDSSGEGNSSDKEKCPCV